MENKKISIRDGVISKIKRGEVKMRPKSYFISKTVLIFLFTALFSLFALYLGSFIVFILQENAILAFSYMGMEGFKLAFLSFPWYLMLLVLSIVIFIEVIVKRFSLVYRRPFIYSILAIFLLVVAGSAMVSTTSVHRSFFDLAEQERLPVMGGMYRHFGDLDIEHVHMGEILEIKNGHITMELEDGDMVHLNITKDTKGHRRVSEELKEGEYIVVIGERVNGTVEVVRFRGLNKGLRRNER